MKRPSIKYCGYNTDLLAVENTKYIDYLEKQNKEMYEALNYISKWTYCKGFSNKQERLDQIKRKCESLLKQIEI